MSETDKTADVREFTPSKETYTSLKSDVDLELALQELIDNAIDAWERHSERAEPMAIDIDADVDGHGPALLIRDDAGGVRQEEAQILFALGRTAKSDVPGTIGTFGLGAKKALVNLGLPFTIASWHEAEEIGWEYTITREWLDDDQNWEVPIERSEDLNPGETEIRIHDLGYDWDSQTVDEIRSRLEDTYNLLLDDSLHTQTYDLEIRIDGTPIEPQGLPDWTYSPFDGIFPRRFENIELDLETVDEPISLHITVGLLRKKDSQDAGTDIYCQNRKVITAARDEVGGYGSGRNLLGNFTVHQERLKVLVELETEGDASNLPWDTQKSSINRHTEVMKEVHDWMSSVVQPYFDLSPTAVPRAFVEFYPADSLHAENNGQVVTHDYSERSGLAPQHKPAKAVPEIASMQQRCKAHAKLRFRCYAGLDDDQRPAYENQLEADLPSELGYNDLPEIQGEDPLEGLDETDTDNVVGKIRQLAKTHARNGVRYVGDLKPWQVPQYNRYFEENVNKEIELSAEAPEDVPTTLAELEEKNKRRRRSKGTSSGGDDSETTDESEPESEPLPEADIAIAMVVSDGEGEQISNLIEQDIVDLNEAMGLDPGASPDELYSEIQRRIQLMVEFDAGIPKSRGES